VSLRTLLAMTLALWWLLNVAPFKNDLLIAFYTSTVSFKGPKTASLDVWNAIVLLSLLTVLTNGFAH
jgi:hypothetical protein